MSDTAAYFELYLFADLDSFEIVKSEELLLDPAGIVFNGDSCCFPHFLEDLAEEDDYFRKLHRDGRVFYLVRDGKPVGFVFDPYLANIADEERSRKNRKHHEQMLGLKKVLAEGKIPDSPEGLV